jgi:hypothetical protein
MIVALYYVIYVIAARNVLIILNLKILQPSHNSFFLFAEAFFRINIMMSGTLHENTGHGVLNAASEISQVCF